jgi:PadR family transcriptional regulator, regulatory protein PadR
MTEGVIAALSVMLESADEPLYGLEVAHRAGIRPGSAYPILQRLEAAGWLDAFWEDAEAAALGRPVRRYYKLSTVGARQAPPAVERALLERRVSRPTARWRPAQSTAS